MFVVVVFVVVVFGSFSGMMVGMMMVGTMMWSKQRYKIHSFIYLDLMCVCSRIWRISWK